MNPGRLRIVGWLSLFTAGLIVCAQGQLHTDDPNIIVLFLLNEQTSGALDNRAPPQFSDSALSGTAQDHTRNAFVNPEWSTNGFTARAPTVGAGIGVAFDRSNNSRTQFAAWMNVSQGYYSDGKDFTVMVRARFTNTAFSADEKYGVFGFHSQNLSVLGSGSGKGILRATVRDDPTSTEFYWRCRSDDTGNGFGGSTFEIETDKWYNFFYMYEQNAELTIAADDGTLFAWVSSVNIPTNTAGDVFDTSVKFSDSTGPFPIGTSHWGPTVNWSWDGLIECVAIWDRVLTPNEADRIGFLNGRMPPEGTMIGLR